MKASPSAQEVFLLSYKKKHSLPRVTSVLSYVANFLNCVYSRNQEHGEDKAFPSHPMRYTASSTYDERILILCDPTRQAENKLFTP